SAPGPRPLAKPQAAECCRLPIHLQDAVLKLLLVGAKELLLPLQLGLELLDLRLLRVELGEVALVDFGILRHALDVGPQPHLVFGDALEALFHRPTSPWIVASDWR